MGLVVAQITDRKLGGAWSNAEGEQCEGVYEKSGADSFNNCNKAYSEGKEDAKGYEKAMEKGFVGSYESYIVEKKKSWLETAKETFGWKESVSEGEKDTTTVVDDSKDDKTKKLKVKITVGVILGIVAVVGGYYLYEKNN